MRGRRGRGVVGRVGLAGNIFALVLLRLIVIVTILDQSVLFVTSLQSVFGFDWGFEKDVITPGPAEELAQLLEDEKVEDSAGGDLVIVVAWNLIPVEATYGL